MTLSEDIKKFLPQYLTEESTQVLLKELEAYCVDGTTNKVYSIPPHEDKTIYQGDGISNLVIVNIAIYGASNAKIKSVQKNTGRMQFDILCNRFNIYIIDI